MENRPQGRDKKVSGAGKEIRRRGAGLGTGPVGQSPSQAGSRPTGGNSSSARRAGVSYGTSSGSQTGGKRSPLLTIIIAAIVLLGGGGLGLNGLLGGGSGETSSYTETYTQAPVYQTQKPSYTQAPSSGTQSGNLGIGSLGNLGSLSSISSLMGGNLGSISSGWGSSASASAPVSSLGTANTARLDTSVDPAARPKYTKLLGSGQDTVTIMVYMCGSDLESKNGMGTSDLAEMTKANLSDKVNLLVYTGGATSWKNNLVSSSTNQIYKVESGGLRCLVSNDGNAAMTDPATLTGFINYCAKNYPASRNELIFWNHGGGSISGYGYDEKNPRAGSMGLSSISRALKNSGMQFDFIGFDACLMGTLENALTLTPYADYLIASEETEPGIGWYYTDWLTALSANTSLSTLELGKQIVDDFVATCDRRCAGQKTTLSVVDLAELEKTVPDKFSGFARSLSGMLEEKEYAAVSNARVNAREFATSSKVDQVDLVDLANRLDTDESKALAKTLLSAVKYNRTSSSITNAYGISIYFPYQKKDRVNSAVNAYNSLGLDSDYTRCIQEFAAIQGAGQVATGGQTSPYDSLMGASSGGSLLGGDLLSGLMSSFLSGGGSFGLTGRALEADALTDYISANRLDPDALRWEFDGSGYVLDLPEAQWSLVHSLNLSVYYDDGEGFIDLGMDNVYDFTDAGALKGEYDGTWLAIDSQPVAYYYENTVVDGDSFVISGRVPVLLNGERAELLLIFDSEHPAGFIAGARSVYADGETETVSKATDGLTPGEDVIEFIADYYAYDGSYQDSYVISDPVVYTGSEVISNVTIDAQAANACYLFTDLYNQSYWTPLIP